MSTSTPSTKLVVEVDKLAVDGNNYLVWKHQLMLILKAQQLWAYVDPSKKTAATLGILTGVQWDDLARIQIEMTIDGELTHLVMDKDSPREVWKTLTARFDGTGIQSAAFLMGRVWRTTMQDDKDLTLQINEVCGNCQKLASLGYALDKKLITIALILSLPQSYDCLQTILAATASDKLQLDSTIATILAEES